MREGNFNRVERAERVEKGLEVSGQELGLAAKNTKSAKPWSMVRLGDVCEIKGGFAFKSKEYADSGLQVVRISDLSGNEISKKDAVYYPETVGLEKYVINEECILICLTGSIGKMAIVNDGVKRYLNQRVGLLTCSCEILIKYVWHYLHSERVLDIWDKAKTSVNGNLRNSDITDLKIPLPPIEVQKEIVERVEKELGEADKVAAEFKRMVELADKEFKAELDETFGGLREKESGVSSQELGLAAKNAESAKPWPMVRLGDVCEVARGGSPRPIKQYITDDLNGLNWIKIGDVDAGGKYIEKTSEKIKLSGLCKTRKVNAGEFLLSNSMSFGRPYILKIDGCIHDGWLVLRGFESVLEENFFYYLLRSRLVQEQFELYAHGSTVRNLNTKSVEEVQIPLPPIEVQKEIVAKLEAEKERCEKLKAEAERGLRAAENLRKAILSEAFKL